MTIVIWKMQENTQKIILLYLTVYSINKYFLSSF
jgi:hypothetical protein